MLRMSDDRTWSLTVDNNDGGEEDYGTDAGDIGNSNKDGDFDDHVDDDVGDDGGDVNNFIPDLQPASRGSCCLQHIVSLSLSPSNGLEFHFLLYQLLVPQVL